jgi:hypothetical protein
MPDAIFCSPHAVKRCIERGISDQQVLDTIRLGKIIRDDGQRALYALKRMRVSLAYCAMVVTVFREAPRPNPKRIIQKLRKQERKIARGMR